MRWVFKWFLVPAGETTFWAMPKRTPEQQSSLDAVSRATDKFATVKDELADRTIECLDLGLTPEEIGRESGYSPPEIVKLARRRRRQLRPF
jgi:hypothetical protein